MLYISYNIFGKISRLRNVKKHNTEKGKFHKQIITLFVLVTIIPCLFLYIFSVTFFNLGVNNLFQAPIKNVISNAEQVASMYIEETKLSLERFISGLSNIVIAETKKPIVDIDNIKNIFEKETQELKIDVALFCHPDSGKIEYIATTPYSLSLKLECIPTDIYSMPDGSVISWESNENVMSLAVISMESKLYLFATTSIDKIVLDHKHKIKKAVNDYTSLMNQSKGFKISFMTFFASATILLLLLVILIGIMFANNILKPINKLIIATKQISYGDYDSHISQTRANNEWGMLINAFNNMVSRLEQQKQQLIVSNKQAAWSDIARKIAHEIKNPLTPIQLSAERLKNKFGKEIHSNHDVFNSCVDTIIRQVSCIGKLVKEFSDFARMPAPNISKTDIVKVLKDVVLIQKNYTPKISITFKTSHNEIFADIDQMQINQVLLNVLQNAVNAITENNKFGVGQIIVNIYVVNQNVHIEIEDDGPGFSEDAKQKALDPYFTTRELGTGLGMAIAHKILTDHLGNIAIKDSETLGGAKIIIQIPVIYKGEKSYGI